MVAELRGQTSVLLDLIQLIARSGVLDACQELSAHERCGPKRVMCLQQERTIIKAFGDFHEALANLLRIIQMSGTPGVEPPSPQRREQLARSADAVAQILGTPVYLLGRRCAEALAREEVWPKCDVERDLTLRPLV
jgi:hypothetical protein